MIGLFLYVCVCSESEASFEGGFEGNFSFGLLVGRELQAHLLGTSASSCLSATWRARSVMASLLQHKVQQKQTIAFSEQKRTHHIAFSEQKENTHHIAFTEQKENTSHCIHHQTKDMRIKGAFSNGRAQHHQTKEHIVQQRAQHHQTNRAHDPTTRSTSLEAESAALAAGGGGGVARARVQRLQQLRAPLGAPRRAAARQPAHQPPRSARARQTQLAARPRKHQLLPACHKRGPVKKKKKKKQQKENSNK
jgi:hypothetical protein